VVLFWIANCKFAQRKKSDTGFMKVTYYGHSCFGVETTGKHLLFDPFITGNPMASSVKLEAIKADFLLVSHAHQDHVLDALAIAHQTKALMVCNFEIYQYYNAKGYQNIRPLGVSGAFTKDGITIKCVNAIHTSTFDDGTHGGSPIGFVITSKDGSFYYAGDTGLTYDMKLIGDSVKLNFAMLPIGDNFTMGADDAIIAANFVKTNTVIGMHFDTFDIIKIDQADVTKKFDKAGKKLSLMKIGETKDF
jgi:L-ascorbate metabolism protein UlaG (beta-lactamase superfamily)